MDREHKVAVVVFAVMVLVASFVGVALFQGPAYYGTTHGHHYKDAGTCIEAGNAECRYVQPLLPTYRRG